MLLTFNGTSFRQLEDVQGDFSFKLVAPASDPSGRVGLEMQFWRGGDTPTTGVLLGTLTTKAVMPTAPSTVTWDFHADSEDAKKWWGRAVCTWLQSLYENDTEMIILAGTWHSHISALKTEVTTQLQRGQAEITRRASSTSE